ncbi:MAG: hypothetical protein AAFY46_07580, partial [Planctomycetota bacterium]
MRHALALHLAPLMLRIGLGLTFVWAGAAKLTQEMPVTDQNRAQLAAWGVIEGGTESPEPQDVTPEPDEQAETPDTPSPADEAPPEPESEADGLVDPVPAGPPADDQASAETNASPVAFQSDQPE